MDKFVYQLKVGFQSLKQSKRNKCINGQICVPIKVGFQSLKPSNERRLILFKPSGSYGETETEAQW